jgi:hypothetical protein
MDERDADKPQPPGSPMRRDEPTASVNPGEPAPEEPHEPSVLPSSTPEGPQTVPSAPTPEGEPGPDLPEQDPRPETDPEQIENAGTSLDEPSDDSGSEGVSR